VLFRNDAASKQLRADAHITISTTRSCRWAPATGHSLPKPRSGN